MQDGARKESLWQLQRFDLLPVVIVLLLELAAWGQDAGDSAPLVGESAVVENLDASAASANILDLDLDQLTQAAVVVPSFDVPVTSVTRSESTVGKSPAAVFVITQEMIRRSGATSLPEALRMAPGLDVARSDSNKWAISSRGFNSTFANKLLVMIDGRSVYYPLFGGVSWEIQDYPLQDVERIEVIRGPGATLWGENAVNGVINIITKSSKDTQGLLVSTGGGTFDRAINTVRYGGQTESGWSYRVFGRETERGTGFLETGAHDDWRLGHTGFRADRQLDNFENELLTIQGDLFTTTLGESGVIPIQKPPFSQPYVKDSDMFGGDLLGRWSRGNEDSTSFVQVYYDRVSNRTVDNISYDLDTFDFECQHRFLVAPGNHLTLGANVRHVLDDVPTDSPFFVEFTPVHNNFGRYGVSIQDEIEVVEDRLTLFAGSKLSTNTFTGFEYQPSIRGIWSVDRQHAVWASVSRAVRLPSRSDRNISFAFFDPNLSAFTRFEGSPQVNSEDLTAYELGYRAQETERLSWDVAAFYNVYTDLIGLQFSGIRPGPAPYFFTPQIVLDLTNSLDAEAYGIEHSWTYEATENWRLRGWYALFDIFAHGAGAQTTLEGYSPQNQAFLMSSWNLGRKWETDLIGRYVDSLPAMDVSPYITLDARLGFRPNDRWELSVVGQNLLDGQHREFREDYLTTTTEVPRGVYFQAVLRH
jgi:iron complex outermembrane receptor protein